MRRTKRVALDVRGLIDRVDIFRLSKGARRDPAVARWLSDEPVEDAPFGYVNTFKRHVNVGFFYGALLEDPAGLLEGSGKRMRHVKLEPNSPFDAQGLRKLIADAYTDIKSRLEE
jgi:hypothetical protein